ncbi:MAG: bifunctional adenosylcobinamide kinase/adenosylcobinamide-phosphate guanylyltransferase [Enterocloster sp.]
MIKVVTGAGASGKSSFAESLLEQSEAKRKIYAATMIVWDDECRARVKKHRQMREKKGFETAERPVDLGELFVPEDGAVLVECMSNLAANEMYREDVGMESCAELRAAQAGERILRGLRLLAKAARDRVVVTTEVFGEIKLTEEETAAYQRLMGRLNGSFFHGREAWEVVCGIPVQLKGKKEQTGRPGQNWQPDRIKREKRVYI